MSRPKSRATLTVTCGACGEEIGPEHEQCEACYYARKFEEMEADMQAWQAWDAAQEEAQA